MGVTAFHFSNSELTDDQKIRILQRNAEEYEWQQKSPLMTRLLVGDEMVTWIPIVFQRSSRPEIGRHRLNSADESANYLN